MIKSLKNYVDSKFNALSRSETTVDTEKVSYEFKSDLEKLSNAEFCELLITAGYIPDLYSADSSEETLFTKLCEILEMEWAQRMGFKSQFITQKASYEDVDIFIDNNVIVSDTKSYRLSRSQAAPNVKDFVKPEDYNKWLDRHTSSRKLGGLVVYPQLLEWKSGSDAHLYCSDKKLPIVMLPFHYLAYLLHCKDSLGYNTKNLIQLWNYKELFPKSVGKDRLTYWKKINHKILTITGDTQKNMIAYLKECEKKMLTFIKANVDELTSIQHDIEKQIRYDIASMDHDILVEEFTKYKLETETSMHKTYIERILKFRTENRHTMYYSFIDKGF